MAAFLFFMLAANNVIKVVRDSLFLSRFPITQLPYVYLLAALLASVVIGVYSRYTAKFSLSRLIPGSLVFVISNLILFWLTITLYDADWILYAYYMWSAIGGLILVAQAGRFKRSCLNLIRRARVPIVTLCYENSRCNYWSSYDRRKN